MESQSHSSQIGGLRRRAAMAVGWSLVRFGGDQIFSFAVFAILAHRLTPIDFGVFIVGLAVVEIGKIVAQGGLVSSLYRVPDVTPVLADTVFWSNLALSSVVAACFFICSSPIAHALGNPQSSSVIAALAFVIPISALGATHMSQTLRNFGHRTLALRSLIAGVIGGGLAIAAAEAGWGVWALVVQRFANEAISTIVAWHAFRWRPGFQFSPRVLREQWKIGAGVAGSQLLLVALNRAQDVIIGRVLGAAAVGVYRTAWKSTEVVAQGVINPFSSVAMPTLAKLTDNLPAFRRGYIRIVSITSIVAFPAIVGIGAVADLLIPLLFGPQWSASVPVARVLSLLAAPFVLNFFADPALTVLGKASVIARLAAIQLALTLAFCIAAAPYGIFWFAVAYVIRAYVTLILQMVLLERAIGIRAVDVARGVAPAFSASIVMALAVFGSTYLIPFTVVEGILRLGCLVIIGVFFYAAGLLIILGEGRRAELIGYLRGAIKTPSA